MNATPQEMKRRYKAARGILSLHRELIRATMRVGAGNHPFFTESVGDLQRSYDKAAAWLEGWRKKNRVAKNSRSPRKARRAAAGVRSTSRSKHA